MAQRMDAEDSADVAETARPLGTPEAPQAGLPTSAAAAIPSAALLFGSGCCVGPAAAAVTEEHYRHAVFAFDPATRARAANELGASEWEALSWRERYDACRLGPRSRAASADDASPQTRRLASRHRRVGLDCDLGDAAEDDGGASDAPRQGDAATGAYQDGFDRVRLLQLNMRGVRLPGKAARDHKWSVLDAYLQMWRKPELVSLQECAGGYTEVLELQRRLALHPLSYQAVVREGEPRATECDGHRRGGVVVAWQRRHYRRDRNGEAPYAGGAADGVALLDAAAIEDATAEERITADQALKLRRYAGRRGLAVRLVRKRGPNANNAMWLGSVYVPAEASDVVRAAFISVVSLRVARLAADGDAVAIGGDWQASPYPSWRASGRPNKAHDDAMASEWFDDGSGSGVGRVGVTVSWGLNHTAGEHTYHDSTGRGGHGSIDHLCVDAQRASRWAAAHYGGGWLGASHDGGSPFDHRAGVFWFHEGEFQEEGARRRAAIRPSKQAASLQKLAALARGINPDAGLEADAALAFMEDGIAALVEQQRGEVAPSEVAARAKLAEGTPEAKLRYLRALYETVDASYEHEALGQPEKVARYFLADHSRGLYHCASLRALRDRCIRRWARGRQLGTRELAWRWMRSEVERYLQRRIMALAAEVSAAAAARRRARVVGDDEPCGGQEQQRRLQEHQRSMRNVRLGGGFSVSSLLDEDKVLQSSATAVHAIQLKHGQEINRASRSDVEGVRIWLSTFVPRGDELSMPDGSAFDLERACSYDVFDREMRSSATGKAPGLHPFIVDHLQALPYGHPYLRQYHGLMLQCMQRALYPAHYLQLVATLIPKTYGKLVDMNSLRDIWLINHGAKLAEKLIHKLVLVPAGERVMTCHAGGVAGRSVVEQTLALHCVIEDALAVRADLYVVYVDLIKCFMSFSREAGRYALLHAGVPMTVVDALQALCNDTKGRVATGRYESAFGSSPEFALLRGFLQGAHSSPEQCKIMCNTLSEALGLKIAGHEFFSPDGGGDELVTLFFVDDAVNATVSVPYVQRLALVWSVWCVLTDSQCNIHEYKKTVVAGVTHVRRPNGELRPVQPEAEVYIGGLEPGDPPRRCPIMPPSKAYKYGGLPTRLDGKHHADITCLVRKKLKAAGAGAVSVRTNRRETLAAANSGVLGVSFFYGANYGGTMQEIEESLGPTVRAVASSARLGRSRRQRSNTRLQLHAPNRPIMPEAAGDGDDKHVNDPARMRLIRVSVGVGCMVGYELAHPYPNMMAATVTNVLTALASPLDTPARSAVQHRIACIAWELSCRESPLDFDFGPWMDCLDQRSTVGRFIWALTTIGKGRLDMDHSLPRDSVLHDARWPGYPRDARRLWVGATGEQLQQRMDAHTRHTLSRAGIVEEANLWAEDGSRLLTAAEMRVRAPRLLHHDADAASAGVATLLDFLRDKGGAGVVGRAPWSAADAREGSVPLYAPDGYGYLQAVARGERIVDKASGDGGASLAAALGLSGRPEWEQPTAVLSEEGWEAATNPGPGRCLESRCGMRGDGAQGGPAATADGAGQEQPGAATSPLPRWDERWGGGADAWRDVDSCWGDEDDLRDGPSQAASDGASVDTLLASAAAAGITLHAIENRIEGGEYVEEVTLGADDVTQVVRFVDGCEAAPGEAGRTIALLTPLVYAKALRDERRAADARRRAQLAEAAQWLRAVDARLPDLTRLGAAERGRHYEAQAARLRDDGDASDAAVAARQLHDDLLHELGELRAAARRDECMRTAGATGAPADLGAPPAAQADHGTGPSAAAPPAITEAEHPVFAFFAQARRALAAADAASAAGTALEDDGCGVLPTELRRQVAVQQGQGAPQEAPPQAPQPAPQPAPQTPAASTGPRRRLEVLCPACGADMPLRVGEAGLTCDGPGCKVQLPPDELRHVCSSCDRDICTVCAGGRRTEQPSAQSRRSALLQRATEALRGDSQPRQVGPQRLPGLNTLARDGMARRVVNYYDKGVKPEERAWKERVTGGMHEEWRGRGEEWEVRALEAHRVERFAEEYMVTGDLHGPAASEAAKFLAACLRDLRNSCSRKSFERRVNLEETNFLLRRLVHLEATYPVTLWSASDGTRGKGSDKGTHVARAVVVFEGGRLRTYGGQMDLQLNGYEQHSYEAEMAGFLDLLQSREGG